MLNNGLPYHCLERQHRMRPEISNLVRHMYPVLEDNENVLQYEDIKGVRENLFFIDHNQAEQYNEDGKSFSNEFEANFISKLCDYLLKQGYKESDITILAAYTGQMFCIKGKMTRSRFEGVNINVLDNYQGEENKIILLSLVRSNENGDIGFLSRENRICVALSRAKRGLYILGNSLTLTKKCKHWQVIMNKLKESKVEISTYSQEIFASFGKALPLYCQNHPEEEEILAAMPSDFAKSPDGGCERRCESRLDCGHACRYFCHPIDRNHKEYICEKLCWKHCQEGHICQKQCHFPDNCQCPVIMKRVLKCSHFVKLQCYLDPQDHRCQVDVNLKCGHDGKLKCCIDQDEYKCTVKVSGNKAKCGHEFIRYCHEKDFEQKTKCEVWIEKKFSSCDHTKMAVCSYDLERDTCRVMIDKVLQCGHIKTLECYLSKRRPKCEVWIEKKFSSCDHTKMVVCSHDLERDTCRVMIDKVLQCGHIKTLECYLSKRRPKCEVLIEKKFSSCDHTKMVVCSYDLERDMCRVMIDKVLECGHIKTIEWKLDFNFLYKRIFISF